MQEGEARVAQVVAGPARGHAAQVVDAVAHHGDGRLHAVVGEHLGDVARRDRNEVQVAAERRRPLAREAGLFPGVVGDHGRGRSHGVGARREAVAQHRFGPGMGPARRFEPRRFGVGAQEPRIRGIIAAALGGVQAHAAARAVERLGEFAVDDGEAVAAVERPLDPDVQRRRRRRPFRLLRFAARHAEFVQEVAQIPAQAGRFEAGQVAALPLNHPAAQVGVLGEHGKRPRGRGRLRLVQQQAALAQGVRDCARRRGNHGHIRGHRLDQRHAEAFVRAQAAQRVAALVLGGQPFRRYGARDLHGIGHPVRFRERMEGARVIRVHRPPRKHQARGPVEHRAQLGQRLDQQVLALVRHQAAHEKHMEGRALPPRIQRRGVRAVRGALRQIHQQGQDAHVAIAQFGQIARVVGRDGDRGVEHLAPGPDLLPSPSGVAADVADFREQLLGRDVVIDQNLAAFQPGQPAAVMVAHGVVHEQNVARAIRVVGDRVHRALEGRIHGGREDLRGNPKLVEEPPREQHRVRDAVAVGGAGVELMHRGRRGHEPGSGWWLPPGTPGVPRAFGKVEVAAAAPPGQGRFAACGSGASRLVRFRGRAGFSPTSGRRRRYR